MQINKHFSVWNDFFFFLTEQQREDRGVQDEKQRVQPTHTAVPSRGTGAWREQREDRCKRLFSYQNDCKSLLQFTCVWHGEFQGHVVSPEISVVVHAPCVPHDSSFDQKPQLFPLLVHLRKKQNKKKLCTAIKRGNIRTLFALLSRPGRILAGLSRSLLLLLQHKAHVREVT